MTLSTTSLLDIEIAAVKQQRQTIQELHDNVSGMPRSRSNSLVLTKLDEASMWLGKRLQELNTPNPYPGSKDPAVKGIDPTAAEATNIPTP